MIEQPSLKDRSINPSRKTKETDISLSFSINGGDVSVQTPVQFFNHILNSFAFHGSMGLKLKASGDVETDPHHLVEDVGLVLGDALYKIIQESGPVKRFGHSVIPMDDALSEVTVDISGRAFLVYNADYPQPRSGDFDMSLVREFLLGFTNKAQINLHAVCRYGLNSHHMAESLFKALGRALKEAAAPSDGITLSTKGVL